MSRIPLVLRWSRTFALLGVGVLVLSLMPVMPASAALVTESVDDTLTDFARGTFQRSSLASLPDAEPPSELGAVQLSRDGVLKQWLTSSFNLPEQITDVGSTAVGSRIYVVGGTTNNTQSSHVWWTQIDPTTGAPILPNPPDPNNPNNAWRAGADLPPIQTSTNNIPQFGIDCTTPVAGRASPAVTSVSNSDGSGYIYVIGGSVPCGPSTISSFGVNIGTVDSASGAVTWSEGPRVPLIDPTSNVNDGIRYASAVSLKLDDGMTYVYVMGGLRSFYNGPTVDNLGSQRVFYAQVSSGRLVKPSDGSEGWDETNPIFAIPANSSEGLWDAAVVGSNFANAGPAIFLMGGQVKPGANDTDIYSSTVYRAKVGSNGALTWDVAGTLPSARLSLAAAENHGKLYVAGGRAGSSTSASNPQNTVLGSYVDDNLNLANYNGANFLSDNTTSFPPRARQGVAVVSATPTPDEPNAAYVYMIAGSDQNNAATNTLIYGKVGGVEDTDSSNYMSSGWFYSSPYEIVFSGAQVQEVDWKTLIPNPGGMDIRMDYRISTPTEACTASNAFNGSTWQTLDGTPNDGSATYSVDGMNTVSLDRPVARCFQYRAYFTTGNIQATPALLMVGIKIYLPGAPDLTVSKLAGVYNANQSLTGLDIEILNHNTSGDPTLAANQDGQPDGGFFVDLWIFAPGQTPQVPSIPIPQNTDTGSKAYVQIPKAQMSAGTTLTIANDQWCPTMSASVNDTCPQKLPNLLSFFSTPGTYKVVVAVDSVSCGIPNVKGCVDESSPGGEDNNVSQIVDIVVTSTATPTPTPCSGSCIKINLPFITR